MTLFTPSHSSRSPRNTAQVGRGVGSERVSAGAPVTCSERRWGRAGCGYGVRSSVGRGFQSAAGRAGTRGLAADCRRYLSGRVIGSRPTAATRASSRACSPARRVRKFRHGGFAGRSCWRVGRLNPCAARRGSTRTNRRDPEDSSSAGDHAEAAVTPPAAKLTVSSTSPTNTRGREHAQALAKAEVSSSLVPVSEGGEA